MRLLSSIMQSHSWVQQFRYTTVQLYQLYQW